MNTSNSRPELLAAYFTISGDVHPFGPTKVSPFHFRDRVRAAAEAGYCGLGIGYADLMAVGDQLGYAEMHRILQGNGIKHIEFELLTDWYSEGPRRRESDQQRIEFLKAAEALGARGIKVWADMGERIDHQPKLIEEYAVLCRQAQEYGTKFLFEVTPFDTVRSISGAREIMEACGEKNSGLLLDIWHISRGHMNLHDISALPKDMIQSIELADADRYALSDVIADTCHRRRLCGEGCFDIDGFVRAVKATGYEGPWGVEILSETFRKAPLEKLASTSFEAASKYLNFTLTE